jgi:uncharacterized low-complexity protein
MILRKNLLIAAVSTTLALGLVSCSNTGGTDGTSHSSKEGKCGEGKCGAKKAKEGKCGEGKCGANKAKKEGKCGEGKCGTKK